MSLHPYSLGDDDIFEEPRGYTNTQIPGDIGISLEELVRIALYNIERFDTVAMDGEQTKVGRSTVELSHLKTYRTKFEEALATKAAARGWSAEACQTVAKLKKACPPDRLYRIKAGFRSTTRGHSPLAVIVDYRPTRGGPAEAGMVILGAMPKEHGSADRPFGVPAEALEDVTEDARNNRLPETKKPTT
jgi:hypothetical protein